MFRLRFTKQAASDLKDLRTNLALKKRSKAVLKALAYLECDPKHPSLNTHKYKSLITSDGNELFEAYVENHTPGAYRIFWYYGPENRMITIVSIVPHP